MSKHRLIIGHYHFLFIVHSHPLPKRCFIHEVQKVSLSKIRINTFLPFETLAASKFVSLSVIMFILIPSVPKYQSDTC